MNKHTHLGVYFVLIKNNQILLIKKSRGPHKGKWDLPGGSIEFGEDPYETLSYTLIYPFKKDELEELHHIGIIYDVELTSNHYALKTDGDGEDSLGACWIHIDEIVNIETTPFVRGVLS